MQLNNYIKNPSHPLYKSEEELLIERIRAGETQILEFKTSIKWNYHLEKQEKSLIDKILKEIAGFMNSKHGGKLLIGVDDDGSLFDIQKDFEAVNPQKKDSDGYSLFLSDKIRQKLGANSVKYFNITFPKLGDKQVCQIEISPSKSPIFLGREFVSRIGTQAVTLSPRETYEYIKTNELL